MISLKKERIIEELVCDFCGKPAIQKCELCGRDVCVECARWVCRKESHPVSGGPYLGWGSSYDPYPYDWKEERKLCKDCVEKFKLSIALLAGKKNEEH